MANIQLIRTSNGSGPAALATVQAQRSSSSMILVVDTVSNFNTGGFIATAGTPKNIALASGENLLVLENPMVFEGHIDSGDIIIDSVVSGYSDNGNDIGDVIIVKPTSSWGNEIADILEVSLDDDGTLNATAISQIASGLSGASIRLAPRINVQTTTATLTPDIDSYNYERITGQTGAITVANPTGTPNEGDGLLIEITGTAAQAITWGTDYVAKSQYGLALPATTVTTQTTFITFVWDSTLSKWVAIL